MLSNKLTAVLCAATALTILPTDAFSEAHKHHDHHGHHGHHHGATEFNAHLGHDHSGSVEPQSLMGTHMHEKGEWMVSYRYRYMRMSDIRDGTDELSEAEVIGLSNPFSPPANLRVVPTDMNMHMHMFGAMYGVTDWLTLAGMAMYMKNDMDHVTYNMAGTKIGTFETSSSGLSDLKASGLIRLYEDETHKIHLNAGLSLPTGDITEEDEVLTPMGTTVTLRLPYAMQLGSGTYDALPGITYTGHANNWGWGLQYMGEIRLEDENDEGYSLGDKHSFHAWGGYALDGGLSLGSRVSYTNQDSIDGRDTSIAAPVPTANPDNYGGDYVNLGLFASYAPSHPEFQGHVFGIEGDVPVYQDTNGPQMQQDYSLTFRWSFGF